MLCLIILLLSTSVIPYECKYKINEYLYKSFRDKRDMN